MSEWISCCLSEYFPLTAAIGIKTHRVYAHENALCADLPTNTNTAVRRIFMEIAESACPPLFLCIFILWAVNMRNIPSRDRTQPDTGHAGVVHSGKLLVSFFSARTIWFEWIYGRMSWRDGEFGELWERFGLMCYSIFSGRDLVVLRGVMDNFVQSPEITGNGI